jgi:hypothetical protein
MAASQRGRREISRSGLPLAAVGWTATACTKSRRARPANMHEIYARGEGGLCGGALTF